MTIYAAARPTRTPGRSVQPGPDPGRQIQQPDHRHEPEQVGSDHGEDAAQARRRVGAGNRHHGAPGAEDEAGDCGQQHGVNEHAEPRDEILARRHPHPEHDQQIRNGELQRLQQRDLGGYRPEGADGGGRQEPCRPKLGGGGTKRRRTDEQECDGDAHHRHDRLGDRQPGHRRARDLGSGAILLNRDRCQQADHDDDVDRAAAHSGGYQCGGGADADQHRHGGGGEQRAPAGRHRNARSGRQHRHRDRQWPVEATATPRGRGDDPTRRVRSRSHRGGATPIDLARARFDVGAAACPSSQMNS